MRFESEKGEESRIKRCTRVAAEYAGSRRATKNQEEGRTESQEGQTREGNQTIRSKGKKSRQNNNHLA